MRVPEISPFTRDDRDSFRRVTIKRLGDIALDALAERLGHHKQVLCVVNTRSKAQCLHDRLAEDDAEGSFCLTTLQCAADRQRLFAEIRDRLDAGASCRVVSTSLIEAGVDVDFPVAYREEAGLDSVIQTAGRCNREGRRPVSESVVHVFSTEGGCAPFLRQNIAAFRAVADRHADLNTDEAVRAYFAEVLCLRNGGAARATVGNDALDRKRILPLHGRDANWPFADIAKRFRLIDTPTIPVYIPLPGEGSLLCERLERGDMDRTLFRKLGRYAVNVWPRHLEQLKSVGAVLTVGSGKNDEEDCFVLRDMDLYSARLGLRLDDATADGILVRVRPLGDFSGKKPVNIIPVPARFPRSSGIVANFLCDNVTYLLGCDTKGNAKRSAQAFQACGELHRRILDGVKDRAASAVCAFFSKAPQWQTAQRLMGDEAWKSSVTMNFALEYDDGGRTIFVGELPSIQEAWDAYYGRVDDADESALVSSLVSGERIVPEKVHPKIKGVAGAQPSGASVISFNAPAFCSHGAEQNENAPMSKREAYEYTTALNTLLADRDLVQRIGGDTVISWARCGDNAYRDVWDQYMGQSGGLSEKVVVDATRALAQGKPYDYEDIHLSPDEQFHILALSPNAARLSVRFYLTDTFGAFARNIDRHYRDTAIRRPVYDSTTFLPTWRF